MTEELARHGYRISPGTLYPLLHSLEKKAICAPPNSATGNRSESYRATPLGRKALVAAKNKVREFVGAHRRQIVILPTHVRFCSRRALCLRATAAPPPADPRSGGRGRLRNYPSIRVSQEQINAAAAGIRLARTAYLPRVDGLAQVNRATRNNFFGLLLPQNVIPSMSGPVLGPTISARCGAAAWACWSLGSLSISVCARPMSRPPRPRGPSEATLNRTEFDVAVAAADAYLTLVAAQETVAPRKPASKGRSCWHGPSCAGNAELRPGADASRAEAELAAARTQLIQAEQAIEVARATLAQFVGFDPDQ